ncbi:hypothetical protein WJX73_010618 [Symbiochloris irregularis]|uniref:tRNA 4-demethylwyosine synthase (AdoMet-dependent) n=1 Tax=Symbiochloris irregularis TaxID=706552 RepID=A0AAW1PV71_9CHLO
MHPFLPSVLVAVFESYDKGSTGNPTTFEYEVEHLCNETVVCFLVSTQEGGTPPQAARWLMQWLEESSTDFRVGRKLLQNTQFAVFGAGNSAYAEDFNKVARQLHKDLIKLGAQPVLPCYQGDEDTESLAVQAQEWGQQLLDVLQPAAAPQDAADTHRSNTHLEVGNNGIDKAEADKAGSEGYATSDSESEPASEGDMEDLAGPVTSKKYSSTTDQQQQQPVGTVPQPKQMLNPALRAALTRQGYSLIGSHSGVKLCRWTKSMLRGRGGCYKHSFYGIESHRCMETTPSLACANKCVFCWRHHTNPVGREWRWQMDEPQAIVEGAIASHVRMVRSFSGAPGVQESRLQEGYQIRHCALSLVGEPIMYPRINELLDDLHSRDISSFLVTNAQFPNRIRHLGPVTQLYVSVDAATRDELKAIDRPLFSDFWERFRECLTLLRDKHQRTVYRLTLVKGWNMAEIANYAALLELGRPDFVEIKGVTYCGSSGGSKLTMQNVPFHDDVREFGKALCEEKGGAYGLACEHEHSCCILLARSDTFLIDGRWHTWIDYDRFQELVRAGEPFSTTDYMRPTPDWAVYDAPERGFDPQETRVRKIRNHGKALALPEA